MSIRRLMPQRFRVLFVLAFIVLRLTVYSIVLFKFFILMSVPQSILAYVGCLLAVAGIWKLAGWYEPKVTGGAPHDGPVVHPLVGAPGQVAAAPVMQPLAVAAEPMSFPAPAATLVAAPSSFPAPAASTVGPRMSFPAPAAPVALAAWTTPATLQPTEPIAPPPPTAPDGATELGTSVDIFAVPRLRVTPTTTESAPTVIAPVAPTAPHHSAAALVAAMGATWPVTAGSSLERLLPTWSAPPVPALSEANA